MNASDWTVLIPAIVGCLGSLAAYLKAHTVQRNLNDVVSTPIPNPPPNQPPKS